MLYLPIIISLFTLIFTFFLIRRIQKAPTGSGKMVAIADYIREGNLGGKGSPSHKAAVIGDTVGGPFKDTVGPSLNILIKLVGIISLIFLPFFL